MRLTSISMCGGKGPPHTETSGVKNNWFGWFSVLSPCWKQELQAPRDGTE